MNKSIQQIIEEQKAQSKIHKVNEGYINQIIGIDARNNDPEWHKANKQRWIDDPNYGKKVGAKISAAYSTPEGRAKQQAKSKPHTNETKEKIRRANIGLIKSNEIKIKLSVKKIGNQNRCKSIQTPYGIFSSKKLAAEHMISIGITNAIKKLDKFLKTDQTNYFYL